MIFLPEPIASLTLWCDAKIGIEEAPPPPASLSDMLDSTTCCWDAVWRFLWTQHNTHLWLFSFVAIRRSSVSYIKNRESFCSKNIQRTGIINWKRNRDFWQLTIQVENLGFFWQQLSPRKTTSPCVPARQNIVLDSRHRNVSWERRRQHRSS